MREYQFYLPDTARNSDWSNNTYVLQLICVCYGRTANDAWLRAIRQDKVPKEFDISLPGIVAIESGQFVEVSIQEALV